MNARTYRFADASQPGILLGLSLRQAVPVIAGGLWLAVAELFALPLVVAVTGPLVGLVVTFGRWRGVPLSELAVPAAGLVARKLTRRATWTPAALTGADGEVPSLLAGLSLIDVPATNGGSVGVVHDRRAGTVTAVLRVSGNDFTLASGVEQDAALAGWGSVLAPFAREHAPVTRIAWHEWAHTDSTGGGHHQFLTDTGVPGRGDPDGLAGDYQQLVSGAGPAPVTHDVLIALSVDVRRVRARRNAQRLGSAVDVLVDEQARLAERLGGIGLTVDPPLDAPELTRVLRIRSDPTTTAQVDTLTRSLAAAAGRVPLEWEPMAIAAQWGHVAVDGSVHRSFRVANWPGLPVGAGWLSPLIGESQATRTVTVVMEPVPIRQAAATAQREVMHREADAVERAERGFFVAAKDRKRIAAAQARETELADGHPEFRFVGLVTVTAPDPDALADAAAVVEQSAAQSLIDLRPLDARHDLGWIASLPLGRAVTRPTGH